MPYNKYCVVPMCTNSTVKTPSKLFFQVPRDAKKRERWMTVMRRADSIAPKTVAFCCEDHFDIENDTENLIKYRLVGGILKLKANICPHKFDCQGTITKGRQVNFSGKSSKKGELSTSSQLSKFQPLESIQIEYDEPEVMLSDHPLTEDSLSEDPLREDITFTEPDIPKNRHKRIKVEFSDKSSNEPSTSNQLFKFQPLEGIKIEYEELEENTPTPTENKSYEIVQTPQISSTKVSVSSFNSVSSTSSLLNTTKPQYCKDTIAKITKHVIIYMGLPEEIFFLTKLLSESIDCPVIDILISLKKIRLDDSYTRLSIDFEVSKKTVSTIFNRTVPLIANRLKQLIYFPPVEEIREKLPVFLRKRYSATVSILDCFEINIEKPAHALQQGLTWSETKHCNTMKYLISMTPDGLINFISEGYGGKASDTIIFEDCNFMQHLSPKCSVIIDKRFEDISHLLQDKECNLIRLPNKNEGNANSELEVMEPKSTAAVRTKVERTISRLKCFSMIAPHACIDNKEIYLLDSIVAIACGIVNVQLKLLKV